MTHLEVPIVKSENGDLGVNEAISHLLQVSKINIGEILNPIGNISIKKISLLIGNLENTTDEIVKNAARDVEKILELPLFLQLKSCKSLHTCLRILSEHQTVRFNSFLLNLLLKKCNNAHDCIGIIEKYWEEKEIDIFNLNTIFAKCSSLTECEIIISKYAQETELNAFSYIILLGVLTKDTISDEPIIENFIKDILIKIGSLGPLSYSDEKTFVYQILSSKGKYNWFILKTLHEHGLTSLYFLKSFLKNNHKSPVIPEEKTKIHTPVHAKEKKQNGGKKSPPQQETEYEKRLKEAYSKNLTGSLAHEYAAGKLDTSIGGGGDGSNKKWGNFTGKKDKN